jgi:hypothetical protein
MANPIRLVRLFEEYGISSLSECPSKAAALLSSLFLVVIVFVIT